MRFARTCYDHIAGRLGTSLTESLCLNGYVVLSDGAGVITEAGNRFFCDFGIDLELSRMSKRALCRTCLDWSERRPHLAGWLGAAILKRSLDLEWVVASSKGRVLRLTNAGRTEFTSRFNIAVD